MNRARMNRRTFLRGTVQGGLAVSIGLPLLDVMLNGNGTALVHGQVLPKRFGVYFFGNGRGVEDDKWHPTGTGAGWTPSVELMPLAGIKDYVSVVTGFNARLSNSPQGHHNGSAAILSGYDFITQPANNAPYRSTFARKSIDQLAADVLGTTTAFRSLEIGLSERVIRGEGTTLQYISHNGPDSGNPAEVDPKALFDRLFSMAGGGGAPTMPNPAAEALHALRASVLDTVIGDLGALKQRVSTADRVRIDQHTESIRAIERRLSTMTPPSAQCERPTNTVSFQRGRPRADRRADGREGDLLHARDELRPQPRVLDPSDRQRSRPGLLAGGRDARPPRPLARWRCHAGCDRGCDGLHHGDARDLPPKAARYARRRGQLAGLDGDPRNIRSFRWRRALDQ